MRLDHVNIRTARLAEMVDWYTRVLGLREGWRPPFAFPGAWLYAGEDAVVHLIGVATPPGADASDLRLEHFALTGDDLDTFRARLQAADIAAEERRVPGTRILQLNLYDPDGTHIHVDFLLPD